MALLADVTTLSARIKELDKKIPALLERLGCTLTVIHGIGVVNAMDEGSPGVVVGVQDPLANPGIHGRRQRVCPLPKSGHVQQPFAQQR